MQYELGIIGAGNMAEAIVRGVLRAGLFRPEQIIAADVSSDRRNLFSKELKVKAVEDNVAAARDSCIVLLSVKPQQMATALGRMGESMDARTLIISIAAGISSAFIEQSLGGGTHWRVIRTMPNTPMLVGQGMVGLSRGTFATPDDVRDATRLFEAAASVIEVPEDQLHAVTAVSGSGPAYFFFLVEQMVTAGMALGLSADQALQLASKTALGAATMLATSADSPAELRRKVTSPNGTTHAAITHMETAGMARTIQDALQAADRRSRELGI